MKSTTFSAKERRVPYAIAYKFPAEEAKSVLRKINWTVGHLGEQVPTAEFDPVEIGGATVSNASLYNVDEIKRLDVAIGDVIVVVKSGDVIPKIREVYQRPAARQSIVIPTTCVACGSPLARRKNTTGEDGVMLDCQNPDCPAKAFGKIRRWIDSLDIKGIGDEVLQAMLDAKVIRSIPDLYRMRRDALSFMKVNGISFGTARAEAIFLQVDKTRTLTIDQFIGSLGIQHLGVRRVQLIREAAWKVSTNYLGDITHWLTTAEGKSFLKTYAEDLGIPGIAEKLQADLDAQRPLIYQLLNFITIQNPQPKAQVDTTNVGPLAGKSYCLTGEMSRPRKQIAADVVTAGGVIKEDVSTGVTLVQADVTSQSGKSKKAKKLGCPIISEAELMQLIKPA